MPWISAIVTVGVVPPPPLPLFCGSGDPVVKSALLLSVSVPAASRAAETALLVPGPAAVSKLTALPVPTKSAICGSETLPAGGLSGVVVVASHTWLALPLIEMPPITSGVGSAVVPPAPAAS